MLKSNLLIAFFVSILVLTLIQENEVGAAPEPCRGLFKIPKRHKNSKPDTDEEKHKDKKKSKKKRNDRLKLLDKLFEDILFWTPAWWTKDMENNKPMDMSAANYAKFLSYLFNPMVF